MSAPRRPKAAKPPVTLAAFAPRDCGEALALWRASKGVGLGASDSRLALAALLRRNPGLSTVARAGGRLVGAALCAHDGRRGTLIHVAVAPDRRRGGLGRKMVARSLERLRAAGIRRCHVMVFRRNAAARAFWRALGWRERTGLVVLSRDLSPAARGSCPC